MTIAPAIRPSPSNAVTLGMILAAPAAIFVVANVLNALGIGFLYATIAPWISGPTARVAFNIISPVVFIGGLGIALAINTLAIARLHMRWLNARLVTTISVEPRLANLVVGAVSGLLLAMLVGYAALENFSILATRVG